MKKTQSNMTKKKKMYYQKGKNKWVKTGVNVCDRTVKILLNEM